MSTIEIPLTQGQVALVDTEYAHFVDRLKWQAVFSQSISGYYAVRSVWIGGGRYKTLWMHRYLWEAINSPIPQGLEIDHINGNPLDNHLENLRVVTHRTNMQNQRIRRDGKTTSHFIGVTWNKKCGRWQAQIRKHDNWIYLGMFDIEEEASEAYQKALAELEQEKS